MGIGSQLTAHLPANRRMGAVFKSWALVTEPSLEESFIILPVALKEIGCAVCPTSCQLVAGCQADGFDKLAACRTSSEQRHRFYKTAPSPNRCLKISRRDDSLALTRLARSSPRKGFLKDSLSGIALFPRAQLLHSPRLPLIGLHFEYSPSLLHHPS